MKLFVDLNENGEVIGYNYAMDGQPATNSSVEVDTFDGIYGGMKHVNGKWEDTPRSIDERSLIARIERDKKLAEEVDPITSNALRFNSMTAEQQQAWADYRQALLDVPSQSGFPHDVVWPTNPE
jgi:hypothetical protein